MNKILFMLLLVGVIPLAFAEEVTVDIPHEIIDSSCMSFEDQYGNPFTQCMWSGNAENPLHLSTETEDGCLEGYDRDYLTNECKTPEVIHEEALALYEETKVSQDKNKTIEERTIEKLEEKGTLDWTDSVLLDKLNKMEGICKIDIVQFQTYTEFEIPVESIYDAETDTYRLVLVKNWDLKNIDYKTNYLLKKIDLKIEECLGQNIMKTKIISEATTNKIIDDSTSQAYHADVAASKTTYPQNSLDASGAENTQAIRNTICESEHFTQAFKNQNACPKPEYISTIAPTHSAALGDEGRVIKWANEQFRAGDEKAIQEQYNKVVQKAIDKKMEGLR